MRIIHALPRIVAWTRFMLLEYTRSGRILVELVALIIFSYVFLRKPNVDAHLTATQFFNMTAIFVLLQTIYTSVIAIGMAQRSQSYVILARTVGRRGFLLGVFLLPVVIATINFLLCSLIASVINPPVIWNGVIWAAGALPLFLDILIVSAMVLLLSSLVLTPGWRLFVLAIVALASLSSSDLLGPSLSIDSLPGRLLAAIRTLVAMPLVPLFSGFELAVQRGYSAEAVPILAAQVILTLAVLIFALAAFDKRDIILN